MTRMLPCAFTFLVLILASNSNAQDAPVPAPHKPIAPKAAAPANTVAFEKPYVGQRSMIGGPWLLDPNMKSTLYLRNSMETASLKTTPILYLSNGTKITLPSVQLGPSATATVSLGDALAKQGIAPYANLRGYVELTYTSAYDPLCATIVNVDLIHSVIFSYGFAPRTPAAITLAARRISIPNPNAAVQQRLDGLWWKHTPTVDGFITVSNLTDQSIDSQLTISGNAGSTAGSYHFSVAPHNTKTIDVVELRAATATEGGAQLDYVGPANGLLVNGGLQDIVSGYSAAMAFRPHPSQKAVTSPAPAAWRTITELGLMAGAPDPMMLFPSTTTFTAFFTYSQHFLHFCVPDSRALLGE